MIERTARPLARRVLIVDALGQATTAGGPQRASLRTRNAQVPVFLMADRKVGGTLVVEVATLDASA